jgi:hypothetical protein
MFILPLYFAWLVYCSTGGRQLLSATQFLVAVLLSCGVAAIHLLPAVQLLPEISRSSELAPELYKLGSLPLRHFFTLVNPDLFGRISPQWNYFGSAYFWTLAFYTPLLLLPLAFLSSCDPAGRRHRIFFLALIPAIFLFAMGTYGPIYDFCHRFIPGVRLFREPARILFFHPLAMAVLAGFGWNALCRLSAASSAVEKKKALWLVATASLLVLLLACGYAVHLSGAGEEILRSHRVNASFFAGNKLVAASKAAQYGDSLEGLLPRTLLASLLILVSATVLLVAALIRGPRLKRESLKGLALLILAADLLFFGHGYLHTVDSRQLFLEPNPMIQKLTALKDSQPAFRVADLSGALSDNLACAFGIDKVGGYDPINLRCTQSYFNEINRREDQTGAAWTLRVDPGFRRELLDRLNVHYLLTREPLELDGMELVEIFEPLPVTLQNYGEVFVPGVRLYRNLNAGPRAWIVAGGEFPTPEAGPDLVLSHRDFTAGSPAAVTLRGPNRVLIESDFPGDGLLLVAQAWSAGWTAEHAETGETLPVYRANGMFTAVPVTSGGPKEIRLTYRPPGLRGGMALSALSLLTVIILALAGRRRQPAKTPQGRAVEEESQGDEQQFVDKGQRVEANQVQNQQQVNGDGQRVEKT